MRRPSQVNRVIDLLVSSERVDAMVVLNFAVLFFRGGCFSKSRENETGKKLVK